MIGLEGNDDLSGAGGADSSSPVPGDDMVDGGPRTDAVDYGDSGAGVSVDLGVAGPQTTGDGNDSFASIEYVFGSVYPDVLRGDGGPNQLIGRLGPDVLEGRGGEDALDGEANADSLAVRDGGPDRADCDEGADTVTADLPGIDILTDCETVIFPGGGGTSAGGGTPAGGGTTGPSRTTGSTIGDRVAPSFLGRVRVDPARFEVDRKAGRETAAASAAKGTSFRYALSEAATVTFTIERKTSGRRLKGRCRPKTRSNVGGRKCTLFKRIGAFRAQGSAGPNAKRFSGRLAKTTLKPGSYRALLTAVDAAANRSTRATASFTVVKPKLRGMGATTERRGSGVARCSGQVACSLSSRTRIESEAAFDRPTRLAYPVEVAATTSRAAAYGDGPRLRTHPAWTHTRMRPSIGAPRSGPALRTFVAPAGAVQNRTSCIGPPRDRLVSRKSHFAMTSCSARTSRAAAAVTRKRPP